MKESVTYQAILREGMREGMREGEIKAMRSTLLRQGEIRFGLPSESISTSLKRIEDLDFLERLSEKVLKARSWEELLDNGN